MGIANLTPGVSGGTIALVSGVLEKLTGSLQSLNLATIKLLLKGRFKDFRKETNISTPIFVFTGTLISVFAFAQVLDIFFNNYPLYTWSFFFGLIIASSYCISKKISSWPRSVFLFLLIGLAIALFIASRSPAKPNSNFFYVLVCGVITISSMIVPGLSGSYILILMGNYQLILVDAIANVRMVILFPMFLGNIIGLFSLSHFLTWLYNKFKNQTLALLTGFVLGSLAILWPWKKTIYETGPLGEMVLSPKGDPIILRLERYFPENLNLEVIIAILLIFLGIFSIMLIDRLAKMNITQDVSV